ncbi:MAG TPA: BatA domain-containing protein [Tepidisphaeraceae bacterium]|nr:BatA domain-containing protein [Tepidisphaeraceae bacterium]
MFSNMIMLAGLGGAVIPLVLHLLSRARHRSVDWGAMMFLQGRDFRQAQSTRLRQSVLLLVRMLIVALLAMALARPVVRGKWSGLAQKGRVTAVIILDRSYSMAYQEVGRTRFDKARDAVLQILASLRKGDEVSLILLGDQLETLYRDPTTNLQMAARDVAELQVSNGMADFERGLAVAKTLLDQPTRINRELYLVCDRQAVNWRTLEHNSGAAFRKGLAKPNNPTRFFVIPGGGDDTENVAIESLALVDPLAVRGQPAEAEIRVRNHGSMPCTNAQLTLSLITPSDTPRDGKITGRPLKTASVTVAPMSMTTLRLPVAFDQVGSHVLTARIASPGLEADNRFDTAIDVIDPAHVLIISGDEAVEEVRRESFFLRLALAPYQTALKRPGDPAVVSIRGVEEWPRIDLAKYQVVILANAPQITLDQARALEQKVFEGAGLIIAPGNLSRIDNYNTVLYRNGTGLMPARLEPPVSADGSRATSLLGLELSHPIFRFCRGADPLPGAVVGRYFPSILRSADAFSLGTYASGHPFLIEGPRGRGRVLLITTPLDADWNTLPLQPFFLPFIQSAVRYVCAPSLPSRNLSPGQALIASFDEPLEGRSVLLSRNDEPIIALPIPSNRNQIVFDDTQRPGIYRLQATVKAADPQRIIHFVVQGPRNESDLLPLTPEQWTQLRTAYDFMQLDPTPRPITATLTRSREGRELWFYVLLTVMFLGIAEMWLTRRWSREVR